MLVDELLLDDDAVVSPLRFLFFAVELLRRCFLLLDWVSENCDSDVLSPIVVLLVSIEGLWFTQVGLSSELLSSSSSSLVVGSGGGASDGGGANALASSCEEEDSSCAAYATREEGEEEGPRSGVLSSAAIVLLIVAET